MLKIAHLSSAHPRDDIRIFKMCKTLSNIGHNVSYIVADGKKNDTVNNVSIYDVGASKNRFDRIVFSPGKVLKKALEINSDIYHLHDPELLLIGVKLKKIGKIIIFDSHEDVASQMLSKPYLNKVLLRIIAYFYQRIEYFSLSKFDGVVGATPFITKKLSLINPNTTTIQNFPIIQKESSYEKKEISKKNTICYVGGISKIRGINQMVQSLELTKNKVKLNLIGSFDSDQTKSENSTESGWTNVIDHGFISQEKAFKILKNSIAGVVTFLPSKNHIFAQPNKLFEYMSAGIPVIASNFKLWQDIIIKRNCGICVDPSSPKEIARAIDFLVDNPEEAKAMGRNGKNAVLEIFNWSNELKKLNELYSFICRF